VALFTWSAPAFMPARVTRRAPKDIPMTESSSDRAALAADRAAAEQAAELQAAINRLTRAVRTMEVAFDAANQLQTLVNDEHIAARHILERWEIVGLLLRTAFGQLSFQIDNAIESMRSMLPGRRD
jgi:hypothetical protein